MLGCKAPRSGSLAVKHCSNAGAGGWHNAVRKKRGEKTWLDHSASEKGSPLSNQNTLLVQTGKQWASL